MTRAAILPLLLPLLAAGCAEPPLPVAGTDPGAYRAAFSVEALGPTARPDATVRTAWTLMYRGGMPHAAFALAEAPGGSDLFYVSNGRPTEAQAEAAALEGCRRLAQARRRADAVCRVVAVDGRVEGVIVQPAEPRPVDIFRTSPLHLWHGPQAARGVIIYGHGYGGPLRDAGRAPLPGFVSVFNDAGWDVLRFDREPGDDELALTLSRLIRAVPRLRALGYRQVVLAGVSRGAWQSLMAAGATDGVDAVIALAPAAHGTSLGHLAALDDWRAVLADLPRGRTRVAAALFNADPFDVDPDRRAALLAADGLRRGVPSLVLRPPAPVTGHAGGQHWRFSHDYGACLLRYVEAGETACQPPAIAPGPAAPPPRS